MMNKKRTVILDTETTGINPIGLPHINHRIIEIGAVEVIENHFTGNNFHVYLQPNRLIESGALKIHGITNDFLLNKPVFRDIAETFLDYIKNSELVIHNASFDLGFINQEFSMLNKKVKKIDDFCSIIDTLKIARKLFPGKKNTLDALCARYKINKSHRNLHSAIIDAKLLGKLYLLMTSRQESIFSYNKFDHKKSLNKSDTLFKSKNRSLKIVRPTQKELDLHEKYLKYMKEKNICLWK
ncbi:Dnaq [Buchnera aphidicola str. G002 (Myzus persicae)]|uniref:DNA polymerase III subunit epsilon n=2 Tax=Buchnera aphidicola TaxID=9 RepID=W0P042_BUCMP|nr:Dnaq [Buchnera aphidicola str. USDA (Myzus persicae)]AHG60711.1 Dnaq [Buchnera aphidicola str. W106 (Myzus persicae)]AHG61283.1 Dnaq [Buchnera aphidicola str. G002 (Myzus persicae)]AHG61856.1 Dnaq [Buchnera aphidicola str. F009 (Myzus persicae)]